MYQKKVTNSFGCLLQTSMIVDEFVMSEYSEMGMSRFVLKTNDRQTFTLGSEPWQVPEWG